MAATSPVSEPIRTNPDPALDPAHQHHHSHLHHSPGVVPEDGVAYTKGTNLDPTLIPDQSHIHDHSGEKDGKDQHIGGPPEYTNGSDAEKQGDVMATEQLEPTHNLGRVARLYRQYRWVVHLLVLAFFTGWWIASLVLHHDDKNWVVPFLFWLCIAVRVLFFHVPSSIVSRPIKWAWTHSAGVIHENIPEKFRTLAGALLTLMVILLGTFIPEEVDDNTRENRAVSVFGLIVFIFIFWITSRHRKAIQWRTVIGGMLAQFIIGLFVLKTTVGLDIFQWIADRAGDLLGFSSLGVEFLTTDGIVEDYPYFFFTVLPAIIFFIALVQVLFQIGVMQWLITKFATFVFWALRVSGAEAVVAAATPFIGQGESAMLVRPFVPHMTKAEIHQIMTCGFATISGSILAAYIGFGFEKQALVSSCIMSIPASIAISKLRYPETEETLTAGNVVIPDDDEHKAENALHAFANGTWFGIKIAATILSSVLCIIAAVGFFDALLGWWGSYLNIEDLTLEQIVSYLCYPIAFLIGVQRGDDGDLYEVAKIIATKLVKNEFVGFLNLLELQGVISDRSYLIATYSICGFGNIGSLGIQIGILSQIAPSRAGDVSRLAFSAFLSGVTATLTSASVAGMIIT